MRRQSSKWVTHRFEESADVPDRPSYSVPRGQVFRCEVARRRQKRRQSAQKCDRQAKQRIPLKIEGLIKSSKVNTPKPFSFTWRQAAPMGPPTCKIVVVKSMLSLFGQLQRDPASSLKDSMDSTSPQTPLVQRSFLMSRPMFPL